MASETGAIYAKILLDESPFTRALNSALNSAKSTLSKISDSAGNTSRALNEVTNSVNGIGKSGNTLGGLNERLTRLNSILDKTQIGSERFKNIQGEINKTKEKIDSATGSTSKFSKILDMAGQAGFNSMSLLSTGIKGAVLALAGMALTKTIQIGLPFQKQMSEVGAAANATGRDFEQLEAKARKLGATTSFSATQAAEGMTELAKAGLNTNQVLTATEDVLNLAKAGGLGLAEATTIAADTMAGFGLEAKDMGTISDVLAKSANSSTIGVQELGETFKYVSGVAKSAGISLQQIAASSAILGNAGIKASQAGTTLKSVILNLSAPTKAGENALTKMGLSMRNLQDDAGNLKSLPEIFALLNDKAKGFTSTQKADIFKDLFGTESLAGALALMDKAEMKFNKTTGKMESDFTKMTDVMTNQSKGFAKQYGDALSNNVSGQLDNLSSAIEEVFLSIWDVIKPVMSVLVSLTNIIVSVAGTVIKYLMAPMRAFFDLVKPLFDYIVNKLSLVLNGIADFGLAIQTYFMKPIQYATEAVKEFFTTIVPAFETSIIENFSKAFSDFGNLIGETFAPIGELLFDAYRTIEKIIDSVKAWFSESSKEAGIIDLIVIYAKDIYNWFTKSQNVLLLFKAAIAPLVAGFLIVKTAALLFWEVLKLSFGIIKDITGAAANIGNTIAVSVSKAYSAVIELGKKFLSIFDMKSVAGNLNSSIKGAIKLPSIDVGSMFKNMVGIDLSKLLSSGIEKAKSMIRNTLGSISDYVGQFGDYLKSVLGEELINDLNNMLNKMKEWFMKMLNLLKSGWESFKAFFNGGKSDVATEAPIKKAAPARKKSQPNFTDKGSGTAAAEEAPPVKQKVEVNLDFGNTYSVLKGLDDAMKSFDEAIKSAGSNSQKLALQIGKGLAVAQGLLQSVGGAMMNLMQSQSQLANAKLENSKQKLDFFAGAINKMNEDTLKAQINAINAETNARKSQFDSQLKALDDQAKAESQILADQKKAELAAEAAFQAEMKALKTSLDSEAKAESERKFNEAWALRQADYDNQKALIEQGTMDETEKAISEQTLMNQAEQEKAALRQQFDDELATKNESNQQTIDQKKAEHEAKVQADQEAKEAAQTAKEEARTKAKELIESQKTAFLAEQENKRQQAQDAADQTKTENARKVKLMEWSMGKGAFEMNKRMQLAQVQIQMASVVMSAMQAMAGMTAATLGFGLPFAIALAATITGMGLAAGATSMSAISTAQYPPPPVFAEGGIVPGNSFSGDNVPAMVNSGEMILNQGQQQTLFGIANGNKPQGGGTNIYYAGVQIGSIGKFNPDEVYEMVAPKIRQEIYQAVRR
jgi:TP901 family phage tail tape measure protein